MKKKLFALALATLLTLSICIPTQAASNKVIGVSKAKSIVQNYDTVLKGKTLTVKLKKDDGVTYYDVKGKTSNRRYEYEIDAYTGKILERDWEARYLSKGTKSLTKAQARQKIDKSVTARKNQKNYSCEVDYEKGIKLYEIEFRTATRKYDITINATTGNIVERCWELRNCHH